MNLTTRLAKLEKHQPQIDQEQRQKIIASIEQWLAELEGRAQTDSDTRLYLEAIRGMLAEKRSAPKGPICGSQVGLPSRLFTPGREGGRCGSRSASNPLALAP